MPWSSGWGDLFWTATARPANYDLSDDTIDWLTTVRCVFLVRRDVHHRRQRELGSSYISTCHTSAQPAPPTGTATYDGTRSL